jgi:hypothetical protein
MNINSLIKICFNFSGPNQTLNGRQPTKKQSVEKWLENSRMKAEALQSVASALNNIASQIGRLADVFEEYNNSNQV